MRPPSSLLRCVLRLAAPFLLLLALACGGTLDTGSSAPVGRFLDSAVEGLHYVSGGQTGRTDAAGHFRYELRRTVAFHLGDIFIGEAQPDAILTPLDLVPGAVAESDPVVLNITRFLLTLDADGNPDNGVRIPDSAVRNAAGMDVDWSNTNAMLATLSALTAETPIAPSLAESHLRSSVNEKLLHSCYRGTYTGTGSGFWFFELDGPQIVRGSGFGSSYSGSFGITGGAFVGATVFAVKGTTTSGATFDARLDRRGGVTGTWTEGSVQNTITGSLVRRCQ